MKLIKGVSILLMAVFLGAALPVHSQDAETPSETPAEAAPEETPAPAKKAKKAKKKKKPAPKPVSEYKFKQIDSVPAYKFDKQTNPIIKDKPKKKTAKKAAAKKTGPSPAAKLKKQPPIDDSGQIGQDDLPQAPPQQPAGD